MILDVKLYISKGKIEIIYTKDKITYVNNEVFIYNNFKDIDSITIQNWFRRVIDIPNRQYSLLAVLIFENIIKLHKDMHNKYGFIQHDIHKYQNKVEEGTGFIMHTTVTYKESDVFFIINPSDEATIKISNNITNSEFYFNKSYLNKLENKLPYIIHELRHNIFNTLILSDTIIDKLSNQIIDILLNDTKETKYVEVSL